MLEQERQQKRGSQSYSQLKSKKMQYQAKPEHIQLTHKHKYMFPLFNLFQLQLNRLATLPQYKLLAKEISIFNQELDDWKKKDIQISNLFVTYHLYQNLHSRMKIFVGLVQFTSNLVIDRGEAKKAFTEIARWFLQEKPKIRNKVPEKEEGQLKPSTADRETESEIDSLLTSNKTKRQLKVYEAMSRTAHTEFFPPKERLLDYKRKEIVQGLSQDPPQRRALSVSNLAKIQRYSGSFASTMASFKRTVVTELKRQESKIDPVIVPFELKEPQQRESLGQVREEIQELQKEKMVVQAELLQQNIIQPKHQEDAQDGEEEMLSQQQKPVDKYKKYKEDPNAEAAMIAQQNIKDAKQSTLRRILKQKQDAIRCKMEELNIKNEMLNWGAVKGRTNSEAHQKAERRLLVNKFKQLQFAPKTFEERQTARKRDIPEYPLFQRSKSSHPGSIQSQVQRLKVSNALKTYGKYINHVDIRPIFLQTAEQHQQMKLMRATSLTSFCKQGKRTPFSKLIEEHGTQRYNDDAEDYVLFAKERLAKTAISVEKQSLLSALGVADANRLEKKTAFPPQNKLFSNPFFPKHLYTSKPKKKAKK